MQLIHARRDRIGLVEQCQDGLANANSFAGVWDVGKRRHLVDGGGVVKSLHPRPIDWKENGLFGKEQSFADDFASTLVQLLDQVFTAREGISMECQGRNSGRIFKDLHRRCVARIDLHRVGDATLEYTIHSEQATQMKAVHERLAQLLKRRGRVSASIAKGPTLPQ